MKYNSVLKNMLEVDEAINYLDSLHLFPHPDRPKSWDISKIIHILDKADKGSIILDVGCNTCPILPMLSKMGFKELYGCDLYLSSSSKSQSEIHEFKLYNLSIQNLENTNYTNNMFDYITSLSVIEHGINIEKYFKEMNRILKKGGMLLTSTDYWQNKISTKNSCLFGMPDIIFSRDEINNIINSAEKNGFELIEPIDFICKDKVVRWEHNGVELTFLFFALKKIRSIF